MRGKEDKKQMIARFDLEIWLDLGLWMISARPSASWLVFIDASRKSVDEYTRWLDGYHEHGHLALGRCSYREG